jgi:hypothetical protein
MTEPNILSEDEWAAMVDRQSRATLGIDIYEFVRRLKAGEFGDPDDDPKVMRIAMLLPSGLHAVLCNLPSPSQP